ncbi:PREDICTED: uncharacterized protein LOC108365629 isoform X2 [Rhagoletis zephyria]|uniref:uncharacterized protein LOC108365629 isoform X2 n=1 Tax=Rhagoletis zephyria TaxID=28612 RepID=UPI0008115FE4|nr:PREDICTED: uncharacterized protein LOC108365629 isoform X2 [Rhagoletis zephyria]
MDMSKQVNYIDNVGDTTNVIARVLDAPTNLPILVQDSHLQSNSVLPPPAHISDVLLDLSKKSTTADDYSNTSIDVANQDILPLDLSLKSSNLNESSKNDASSGNLEAETEQVFDNNDYDSFGPGLDMPLIDIEDNINAFMELTNNQELTSTTIKITTSAVCDIAPTIVQNTDNALPICDFELSEILSDNTHCRSDCNIETQIENQCDAVKENNLKSEVNKTLSEQYPNITDVNVVNAEHNHCEVVRNPSSFIQPEANLTEDNKTDSDKGAKSDKIADNEPSKSTDCESCENKTGDHPSLCVHRVDELHGDSSDKCSIDFLFMDTESLLPNKMVFSFDGSAALSETDTHLPRSEVDQTANDSKRQIIDDHDNAACDLSTKDDHSKSIDLIEDDQCHHVSVHLPMPQLTLMDSSSEEFRDEYELGFESSQEKEDLMGATEKQHFCADQQYEQIEEVKFSRNDVTEDDYNDSGIEKSMLDNGFESTEATAIPMISFEGNSEISKALEDGCSNEKNKDEKPEPTFAEEPLTENEGREASTLDDSAICCKQEDSNADNEFETGTSERKNNFELNGKQDLPSDKEIYLEDLQYGEKEVSYQESAQQIPIEPDKALDNNVPDVVKTCKPDSLSSLSVLEIESKLDDACLDFGDDLEDDAMSLATSCFNSSDDERFTELDNNCVETSPNKNNREMDTKVLNVVEENFSDHHTNYVETLENKTNEKDDTKTFNIENHEKLDDKSKIIKLETTHKATDVSIDIFKKFKIPKISLTTATTKHSNPAVTAAAPLPMVILPPNAFNRQAVKTEPDSMKTVNFENITRTVQNVCAVTPLTLQPPTHASGTVAIPHNALNTVPPIIRDILQLAPSLIAENSRDFKALNTQQVTFNRGEFGGNGGDGRNFGPPTVVVAKTFGVTCLPFLVGRCFTLASCKFSHTFREPETVRNILITFSEVDLNLAYRFAYNNELVFRQYMHEFCRVYFERNNRLKLLHLVRDCERYKGGGELLITIFHSLQYCGLNKVNACRQILSYSRDRSRPTIDALLDIILEADWTMFCDYIEKFSDISSYHFRLNVLHQMASTVLRANDQRMTSLFFRCLVNLDPKDVGLVQSSPILMQLLELIKNGQICR